MKPLQNKASNCKNYQGFQQLIQLSLLQQIENKTTF